MFRLSGFAYLNGKYFFFLREIAKNNFGRIDRVIKIDPQSEIILIVTIIIKRNESLITFADGWQ